MVDQYAYRFAPPRPEQSGESDVRSEDGAEAETSKPPSPEAIRAAACEVAQMLGAPSAEALSCLPAKLADARGWVPASGPEDARIWLVIVRASVSIPRPSGGTERARRIEVAVDAKTGRALGFRTPD